MMGPKSTDPVIMKTTATAIGIETPDIMPFCTICIEQNITTINVASAADDQSEPTSKQRRPTLIANANIAVSNTGPITSTFIHISHRNACDTGSQLLVRTRGARFSIVNAKAAFTAGITQIIRKGNDKQCL